MKNILTATLLLALFGFLSNSMATELVYCPINPSFGGSPLNGSFLLGIAQAQNKFTNPSSSSVSSFNPVSNFENTLTSSVLSMLATKIASASFGNGTITTDVPYEFNGYSIIVHDTGSAYQVSITDPMGSQTTITVGHASIPASSQ